MSAEQNEALTWTELSDKRKQRKRKTRRSFDDVILKDEQVSPAGFTQTSWFADDLPATPGPDSNGTKEQAVLWNDPATRKEKEVVIENLELLGEPVFEEHNERKPDGRRKTTATWSVGAKVKTDLWHTEEKEMILDANATQNARKANTLALKASDVIDVRGIPWVERVDHIGGATTFNNRVRVTHIAVVSKAPRKG